MPAGISKETVLEYFNSYYADCGKRPTNSGFIATLAEKLNLAYKEKKSNEIIYCGGCRYYSDDGKCTVDGISKKRYRQDLEILSSDLESLTKKYETLNYTYDNLMDNQKFCIEH